MPTYKNIYLKSTYIPNKIPDITEISYRELFLNVFDGKLYIRTSEDNIVHCLTNNNLSSLASIDENSNLINDISWSNVINTPTTLSGYGIIDAAPLIHNHNDLYLTPVAADLLYSAKNHTHNQYQSISEKGVALGYATLGADGLVVTSQLPEALGGQISSLAITDVSTNNDFYPIFVPYNSGNQTGNVSSNNLSFNPSTGILSCATFNGNALTATTLATARNINGVSFNGSSNITITANTTNSLTIGTGLSGTSFNGSAPVTITVDSTVALRADTHYIGTTPVALNRASGPIHLHGISGITLPGMISGNIELIPDTLGSGNTRLILPAITGILITSADTGTVTNTMLDNNNIVLGSTDIVLGSTVTTIAGLTSVTSTSFVGILTGNASTATKLANARTINGITFDGTANIVIPSNTANDLTIGTGLLGFSFNGSSPVTIAIDSTVALRADIHYIGTTSVALNRASANLALTGISSVTLPGATSGSVQIIPAAIAGTGTVFTLPAVTGTAITTGDTGTVTNTMLAGSIATSKLVSNAVTVGSTTIFLGSSATTIVGLVSVTSTTFVGALTGNASTATSAAKLTTARTINGVSFDGSANITIPSNTANNLTIGTGLSGTSFNGSVAVTIAVDSTVALRADTHYIGTTSVALNRTSANLALTGISSVTLPGATSGSVQVIPAAVAGTGTVFTLPAVTGTAITTGDTGTVTNTMLAGSIANAKLANSSVTVGSTAISLGTSATTIVGLTSVTSTTFVGALTGNASTATSAATLTTARTINGVSFDGSANITIPSNTANNLTIGTGLSGISFNGSAPVTIAVDSTVALRADTHYIGTTSVALNRTSANLALTGISSVTLPGATSGSVQIIPAAVAGTGTVFTLPAVTGTAITTGDTGTVTNTMLAGSIANAKLANSSVTVGSTAISLGTSATTIVGLTSVTSTTFVGALTGNASTATTLAANRTINGTIFNGSTNIVITANTTNSLIIGSGLSGLNFDGSSVVTIAVDSTVALRADIHYIGTTSVALNRASANLALTGISSVTLPGATSGSVQVIPAAVAGTGTVFTLPAVTGTAITTGDTGTVTNTMLAGSIANAKLANSNVTVGSTAISLGTSATTIVGLTSVTSTTFVGALTGNASTATALATARTINGVSFNGSANITVPPTFAIAETCLTGGIELTVGTKAYVHIPSTYNGWLLTDVIAVCKTASTSGTPTFTVMKYAINSGTAVNMLTTNLTIDITELNSITATVPVAINATNRTVATGDHIEINCTSAGTGVTYINVQLKFSSS